MTKNSTNQTEPLDRWLSKEVWPLLHASDHVAALLAAVFILLGVVGAPGQSTGPCVTINCPANITVDCAGTNGTVVDFEVTASTICGQTVSVTCVPPSGSAFPVGVSTVACTATNDLGNLARCEFVVTVGDFRPPFIYAPTGVVVHCTGPNGAVVNYSATAIDNCDPAPSLICSPPSGSVFPLGTTIVTCTAVDARTNQSNRTFPVTVEGDCGPECLQWACPTTPIVADADAKGVAIVTFTVPATNVCGGDAWVECEPPSGSSFPVGTNFVSCSAGIGNLSLQRCAFAVIVRDVTPPVIYGRPRKGIMSVYCKGIPPGQSVAGANVSFPNIHAKDNVDPSPTLNINPPSGSFFPLGSNTVVCTAQDAAGNQSTASLLVVVKPGPACEFSANTNGVDPNPNWDFELGLKKWTANGSAFEHQPTVGDNVHVVRIPELRQQAEQNIGGDYWRELEYPIGHHLDHWIGTAENHEDDSTPPGTMLGDAATGTLLSDPFKLPERFITFLIGGQNDAAHLRVELLGDAKAGDPGAFELYGQWYSVVKFETGRDEERMRRAFFNVPELVGHLIRLRIVDDSTTGHLNVDDFRFQPSAPITTMVKVGETNRPSVILHNGYTYDWDSPVWGLAELHAHPMAHVGLGQRIFHGQPDGDLKDALNDCNCDHGGWGTDNGCGNYLRQLAVAAFDGEAGDDHQLGWDYNQWKRFQKWPIFTSYSHQQMWYEWVKRSYDGGLRVMVALTVHNHLLAQAMLGSVAPFNDGYVMTNQIAELKAFVARHDDFMEIAYDPFEMREIIRNNKLAIIIGSETDDIGDFDRDAKVSESADADSRLRVKQKLQELHDLGLRYIFPVHLTDNKFAGTAVYNPLFAVATKFYTGHKLFVEGVDDDVHFKLPNMDATAYLPDAGQIVGKIAEAVLNPFAPLQLMLEANGKVMGANNNLSDSSIGLGCVSAVSMLPVIISVGIVAAPVLVDFFGDFGSLGLPSDIYPLGNNYPLYQSYGVGYSGHRNQSGLSELGTFAIKEMMKLGMMVDLDHMSERAVTSTLALAEDVPGGYPMNSGHNSFRKLRWDGSENNRTAEQLARIRNLGGMMGLGWGNGDVKWADDGLGHQPTNSSSSIDNDCPGSSKTFAQSAIYALEHMQRSHIALGTDINGFVVGPGPRFGPQSAFGLREAALAQRSDLIGYQENGIAYEPREGRPGTTGVLNGRAVDHDTDSGWPKTSKGYRYNKEQRDFFMALCIFRWGWQKSPKLTADEVPEITENLNHNAYDWNRVKEFTRGLLLGPTDGEAGSDSDGDVNVKQKLGKAVYRRKVFGEQPPDEIYNDPGKLDRYKFFIKVWEDYEKIYGSNIPMKRCETHLVQWDYNFDGTAHYGLMPDFFQDLSNVGMVPQDLSPLFRSAEDFAQMWTQCLRGADAIKHPGIYIHFPGSGGGPGGPGFINLQWYLEDGDKVEESDSLESSANWHETEISVQYVNGRPVSSIPFNPGASIRFYRVRKP